MTTKTSSSQFEDRIAYINDICGKNDDFAMRRFHVFGKVPAAFFCYAFMVDPRTLNFDILKALMYLPPQMRDEDVTTDRLMDVIINDALYFYKCQLETDPKQWIDSLTRGRSVIFIEGMAEAIILETRQINKRAIEQPQTEQVIRGPREGFIEVLATNLTLIRYRLQTPDLRVKVTEVGRRTQTAVALCYIEGVVQPNLVQEVTDRIARVDIDGIVDSGVLEQYIEDNHFSPFPQIQYTERPDKIVANLLEGRVGILVDGSPLALVVPTSFNQFYQTVEDYTERFLLMSAIRMARLVALMFSLIFPSLYVAIISFNPELIPTEFAVAVAGGRAGVPFPAVVEVLIMEVSMEVLREATIRLPQQVGGALSIVGVLVIGQAAVSAGFASPITVVIIALTTIGSFATPAYNAALALRLLRFPLMILAGIFGLYGVMIGLILIANHMLSLKSFGVPYLSPLAPGIFQGMKDMLIRAPLWWMKKRPGLLQTQNVDRINPNMKTPPSSQAKAPLDLSNLEEEER